MPQNPNEYVALSPIRLVAVTGYLNATKSLLDVELARQGLVYDPVRGEDMQICHENVSRAIDLLSHYTVVVITGE